MCCKLFFVVVYRSCRYKNVKLVLVFVWCSFFFSGLFPSQKTKTLCCITASGASTSCPSSTCLTSQGPHPHLHLGFSLLFLFFIFNFSPLVACQGTILQPTLRMSARGQTINWTTRKLGPVRHSGTELKQLLFSTVCLYFVCFSLELQSGGKSSAPSADTWSVLSLNQPNHISSFTSTS